MPLATHVAVNPSASRAVPPFAMKGSPKETVPLGTLRLEGSRVAVGDHLRLHQQDWNHALIIKAIEESRAAQTACLRGPAGGRIP
jgi:hypothetical protein